MRVSRGAVESTPAFVAGVVATVAALGLGASAIVGANDDLDDSITLGLTGLVAALVGVGLLIRYRAAERETSTRAFTSVVLGWLVLVGISTAAYLLTETFTRFDDALFESFSGVSTTALSVLDDPEATSRGVLFWRSLTQWMGGLYALLAILAVFPVLGVQPAAGESYHAPRRLLLTSKQTVGDLRRLATVYLFLSAVGVAIFLVAGMGVFDAVTYAGTTISSGGFANHAGSFAHFESDLIEWAGIGGMLLAGTNLALVFRSLRRTTRGSFLHSAELKAYLGLIVGVSAVVILLNADGALEHDTIRQGVFSVVSMISTTGATVAPWGTWDTGAQLLLMVLAGIGAMSVAVGSGFRIARVLTLGAAIRSEVTRQLHPHAVQVVKVGHTTVEGVLVERMVGFQTLYLVTVGTGAIVLGLADVDLVTAMAGSVSVVSNVGPAMGELAPGVGGAAELSRGGRIALMPLMMLGRLEFAPVLVGSTALALSLVPKRARRRVWA